MPSNHLESLRNLAESKMEIKMSHRTLIHLKAIDPLDLLPSISIVPVLLINASNDSANLIASSKLGMSK